MSHPGNPLVILVHGIWLSGWEFALMAGRLRAQGFAPRRLPYPDLRGSPVENAALLDAWIARTGATQVHLVGHSLGGIVLLHLFDRFPDQPPGRVVLLGSPVTGSVAARRLVARPWLGRALGRSIERGLLGGAPGWGVERDLGLVAGTLSLGLGRLFGPLPEPNDGTVAVAETRLAGAREHIQVAASHLGLLASAQVARRVGRFLHGGSFGPA